MGVLGKIWLLFALAAGGCGKPTVVFNHRHDSGQKPNERRNGEGEAPPPPEVMRYSQLFDSVIRENCVRCHNSDKTRGGVNLESADTLLNPASGKHVVVPAKPDASLLYTILLAGEMPPDGPLAPEQLELVRRWVLEGAAP